MKPDKFGQNKFEQKMHDLTHRPLFMFALFASTSMTVLGGTVVATSIPAIETHFAHISHIDILSKLILTIPALFIMIVSPISGILLDKFGRLKFLIPAMFAWSVSGTLAIAWDNIYWILFTRMLFGVATAFVMTAASALVADYYIGEDRQVALGLQGFATACGSALFMCLGGFLALYDWHYPFCVYLGGIILAVFAGFFLFEPRTRKKKTHITEDNQSFSIVPFLPIYFFAFMAMSLYYTSPTQIPHFLTHLGESTIFVGISISTSAFAYGFTSLIYPMIRRKLSIKAIYILGFLLMGSGFLLIFLLHNIISISLGLLLVGSGGGMVIVNNSSCLLAMASKQHIAKTMGVLSSVTFFAQFISPFISQPIVRNYGIVNLFGIVALILFATTFIALFKPNH